MKKRRREEREREMKISYHSSLTLYVCSAVVLLYDTVWTVKYVPKACSSEEVPFSKELVLVRNSFTVDYFWVVFALQKRKYISTKFGFCMILW